MVFVGPNGVIVCNKEGIHQLFKSTDEKVRISLVKKQDPDFKVEPVFPEAYIDVPIQQLVEQCESSQEEPGKFVRSFGSRLESNYAILRNIISEIGLNLADYPRKDRTR